MLLKHPSSYKHQVAFTFPATKRDLYEKTKNLLLHDPKFDKGIIEFSLANSENVFCENEWHANTPREFHDAYRDSVLIVVLFDEHYMSRRGTYQEWKIVQELKTQLHRRVVPVKLSADHHDTPIDEPNLFCGCVDLSSEGMTDDARAERISNAVVTNWKKIVTRWTPPPDHLVICFGDAPIIRNTHADFILLPALCSKNKQGIVTKIENNSLFVRLPKRSVCVVAPRECEQEWEFFTEILARITHAYVRRRRSSLQIPLFMPEGINLKPGQSLEEFTNIHLYTNRNTRQAWERQVRQLSTLDDWLETVGRQQVANVIAASDTTFDDAVNYLAKYGDASSNAIINLWRWTSGFFYKAGEPFDLDLESLYHAAEPEHCNMIHLSSQFAEDLRNWQKALGGELTDAAALQDVIFASLCDSKSNAHWRPFLTASLDQRDDRITLARLYCETEPLGSATRNPRL